MRMKWMSVLMLVAALPAQGQERSGFLLTSPLSISAGRENNLMTGSTTIDDSVYLFSPPTVGILSRSPRTVFWTSYQPEYELFTTNTDQNSWNHAAELRFRHSVTRRLSLEFGDSFKYTHDPSRWQSGGFFLLPHSTYKENASYAGLDYGLTRRTSLSLRIDHNFTTAVLPEVRRSPLLENNSYATTGSLSRLWAQSHRLTGTYSYVQFNPSADSPPEAPPEGSLQGHAHSGSLSYSYTHGSNLTVTLASGMLRSTDTTWSASAGIERRFRGVRFRADYQRQYSFFSDLARAAGPGPASPGFANGLLPSAVIQAGTLEIAARWGRRLGADLRGSYARTDSDLSGPGTRAFVARARIDYKIAERVYAFANADLYRQNTGIPSGLPLNRNRYFGGIEIVLSRGPIPEGAGGAAIEDKGRNTLLLAAFEPPRPAEGKKE